MKGYSSAVFSNQFENKFSDYTVEGFTGQIFASTDEEQFNKLNDLVGNYQDISGDLVDYHTLKNELTTGLSDPNINDYNDFAADKLDIDRLPNVKDAAKEDIDTMIVQQNNTYILGMITVTTLLITSFLFIRG
jgi:hypothetical protein